MIFCDRDGMVSNPMRQSKVLMELEGPTIESHTFNKLNCIQVRILDLNYQHYVSLSYIGGFPSIDFWRML